MTLLNQLIIKLILVLVFGFTFLCKGQSPYHYTLNEENGMPSSEVYRIIQDKFGFIWIGCDAGLFRYDGIRFKQYNYLKENGRSISELKVDVQGRVWCQNFTGQIFFVENDSLKLFKDFSKEFRTFPQYVIDNSLNVWVAAEKWIKKYNLKGDLLQTIVEVNEKKDTILWLDIEVDSNNQLYASSINSGIAVFENTNNKQKIKWLNFDVPGKSNIENLNNAIYLITETVQKKSYVISKLNKQNKITSYQPINSNFFVYKLFLDFENNLWLNTSNGVFAMNDNTMEIDTTRCLFKGDKISSFYQDSERNSWFSSLQNGIHVIPNNKLIIYNKFNSPLRDNLVSALAVNKKKQIVIGTYSGNCFLLDTSKNISPLSKHIKQDARSVKKILAFNEGYLVSRGEFNFVSNQSEVNLPLNNIRDFSVFNDTLYFTSAHSIGFLPDLKNLTKSSNKNFSLQHIIQKAGRSVAINTLENKIYFVSIDGLLEFDSGNYKQIYYNNARINAAKVIFSGNKIWIATLADGFLSIKNNKIFNETKINSVLIGKQIKTFRIFGDFLIVATERCLNKINLKTFEVNVFDLTDGLLSNEINEIEVFENYLYLATNKGLVKLPLNTASKNNVAPNIKITNIQINAINYSNTINSFNLKYTSNKISIKFITSCLRARGRFNYKYRLLGSDSLWTNISAFNNEVIFSSLPPGEFTFEVKAVNEDGVESEQSGKVYFFIDKPFWQELWFYLLIGFSGALAVFFVSIWVIKNIKKKARIKNELISSKLTAIRAQMNPHFMYNTLNSIQDLILKSDIKNTNYYLSKFSSLMRKILEFSDNEKVVLEEELEMLNDYLELEKLRFGEEFTYELIVSNDIKTNELFLPSLIIQPFIENAIKHGLLHKKGAKKLHLDFKILNKKLIILIEDNGVGRKRSAEIKSRNTLQHRSFATSAVQRRVELLNSNGLTIINYQTTDLYFNSQPSGTQVEITIVL